MGRGMTNNIQSIAHRPCVFRFAEEFRVRETPALNNKNRTHGRPLARRPFDTETKPLLGGRGIVRTSATGRTPSRGWRRPQRSQPERAAASAGNSSTRALAIASSHSALSIWKAETLQRKSPRRRNKHRWKRVEAFSSHNKTPTLSTLPVDARTFANQNQHFLTLEGEFRRKCGEEGK